MKKIWSILVPAGLALLLSSCKEAVLLNPKGLLGQEELDLIIIALVLMLLIVIPVIVMTFIFAYKYRETNTKAKYDPDWHHSNKIETVVWGIPIVIIVILATITWKTTHTLDPYKPIEVPGVKPLTIQVVALDWRWLFIYPEQNIATINFVQFPENVPIDFKVTADAPMNSFMIPQIGGQIYAMAGMQTHLHLIADTPGDYAGRSVSYSGHGFSGMTFVARVSSASDFQAWVAKVKQGPQQLSASLYNQLSQQSCESEQHFYSAVSPRLYDNIIMKYMMPGMDDLSADHSSMGM
jgi:cytochrome o ubiquinol oxidase subunit 2